jgi:hypothetical protein
MTLQTSGEISLGGSTAGRSVNLTLGRSATASINMNDSGVRSLAGRATGDISFSDFYGKSLNYSIVPNITSVNEGNSVTFTVTTVGIANGTTLFWTTEAVTGTVNTSDFTDAATIGSFTINNNTATITRTLRNDSLTEGTESFRLQVRTGSTSGTVAATSSIVTINDTSVTISYSITPNATSVNEGSSVTFTVSTTGIANGTTLFWTTAAGTVNASDFTDSVVSGSFTINNNTATITRTLTNDATTEGAESFQLQLRTGSTSGTVVATSSTVTINDTSAPTYSIVPNITSVNEGGSVTFTVSTTLVPNGTTLFWTTTGTNVNTNDFNDSTTSGSVTINSNAASIVRGIRADQFTEGAESFQLQLRTGSTSGTVVATSAVITINDTSTTPPPEILFTSSTSWIVPTNVSGISIVCVGGGGGGRGSSSGGRGGGGGALAYGNNYAVTSGETLTITVGAGGAGIIGTTSAPGGGVSSVRRGSTLMCEAGGAAAGGGGSAGGVSRILAGVQVFTYSGSFGGSGAGGVGGGGAGGYSNSGGAGGSVSTATSGSGTGGAGGGGGATTTGANRLGGKGGGVGVLGAGLSGAGVARVNATNGTAGNNGSGGSFGAGGAGGTVTTLNAGRMNGNAGAVRIIWGNSFP